MSLSKNSPLVKRSLCTYPFTTKSKAFFFLNFRMWRLLLICIHFLALFQKGGGKKKLLPFLFTSLLVAININDWGLCDDEIPPSSLRAAFTYPADVSVDGLQHFFETDLCWHPWRCTRWSIAAVEGTKNPDRCFTFKKKKKKVFWTKTRAQSWSPKWPIIYWIACSLWKGIPSIISDLLTNAWKSPTHGTKHTALFSQMSYENLSICRE